MPNNYPLEWIDSIINVTFNPLKTEVDLISDYELEIIIERAGEEKDRLQSLLKNQVFGLTSENKIELLIKQYHKYVIILLDQIYENQQCLNSKKNNFKKSL